MIFYIKFLKKFYDLTHHYVIFIKPKFQSQLILLQFDYYIF